MAPHTKFTLDTNCLIAVEDNRSEKEAVLKLISAAPGEADVAMVASCASERQIGGGYLTDISEFTARLNRLGFGHLELLKPIAAYDVSFYGHSIYPTDTQSALQDEIFTALFPKVDPLWSAHATSLGLNPENSVVPEGWKWRNKLLDAQAIWAHINYGRDVFVTSDKNFSRRLSTHPRFETVVIATPTEVADII
jgi:hypothetical protein